MRAIITGGGTGGHIYPALAIAGGLVEAYSNSQSPAEILYVGNGQGLEKDLASRAGYNFEGISVAGLPRPVSCKTFKALWKNVKGLGEAKAVIKDFKPDLVVGTGGYACGPLMLAAALKGVPTLLHEQNAVMGVTNTILSRFVKQICLTFPLVNKNFKYQFKSVITGLPVRSSILEADRKVGLAYLGFSADKPLIVITGGSQGALKLNRAVADIWQPLLAAGAQILHIAGPKLMAEMEDLAVGKGLKNNNRYAEGFLLLPYLHEMEMALGAADLIIGRAGASFLAEVMAVGKPSILVPYPYATGNHQEANAKTLVEHQAAVMLLDKDLTGETLGGAVIPILEDKALRAKMASNSYALGSRDAVDKILATAKQIMAK